MNEFPEDREVYVGDCEVYIGVLNGDPVVKMVPHNVLPTVTAGDIARGADQGNAWRAGFASGLACASILICMLLAIVWWLRP